MVSCIVSLKLKHLVLLFLCTAFALYSVYVWTAGTHVRRGHPPSAIAMNGMALFQNKNCIACHQFYGLGGHMGPDLTNVVSAPGKGVAYAKAFIRNGSAKMPNFNFDEKQIEALIAFLGYVDATGIYAPRQSKINWNGSVTYGTGPRRR